MRERGQQVGHGKVAVAFYAQDPAEAEGEKQVEKQGEEDMVDSQEGGHAAGIAQQASDSLSHSLHRRVPPSRFAVLNSYSHFSKISPLFQDEKDK